MRPIKKVILSISLPLLLYHIMSDPRDTELEEEIEQILLKQTNLADKLRNKKTDDDDSNSIYKAKYFERDMDEVEADVNLKMIHDRNVVRMGYIQNRIKRQAEEVEQRAKYEKDHVPFWSLDQLPVSDDNVYFIEVNNETRVFPGRILCTFESCAWRNPDKNILVILPESASLTKYPKYLVEKYPNIKFMRINFKETATGLPGEAIWKSGVIARSKYSMVHTSDLLRLNLMYKFGGSYMDTDIVFLRPIPPVSFVVPYKDNGFANGILGFSRNHPFIMKCLNDVSKSYNPRYFDTNGPDLITRQFKEHCTDPEPHLFPPTKLIKYECPDFEILKTKATFPISYQKWRWYFTPNNTDFSIFEDTFGAHYWNNMRNEDKRKRGNIKEMDRDQPLYKLFEQNCPLTVAHVLKDNLGLEY